MEQVPKILYKTMTITNLNQYDISIDVEIVKTILGITDIELAEALNVDIKDLLLAIEYPSKINENILELFYNFAFENDINLTKINWQFDKEEYTDQDHILLCHGSRHNLEGKLSLRKSGKSNDFGDGFYCGENTSQAGMFVSEDANSSLYNIVLDKNDLTFIKFETDLDWVLAVAYFRGTLSQYENDPYVRSIISEVNSVDYVIAPIADNRMFQIIDTFVSGEITNIQCQHALSATYLGYQYVFRTEKSFNNLDIVRHTYLCESEKQSLSEQVYYEANNSVNKAIVSKKLYKNRGNYIYDILKIGNSAI